MAFPFSRNSSQLVLGFQRLYERREKETQELPPTHELPSAMKANISHDQEMSPSSYDLTATSGSPMKDGCGNERSDDVWEQSAKKTIDTATQTTADVSVLKDQEESANQ